ncbi:MAG: hypothetical protein GPI92_10340 [Microcystis aeruginosa K13-06]|jgi:hypothetical protein|uniref:Uncharacterized protein n=1 Tax=Microcystis aeruginosa KW TaxID=1960155 RepID=A0A1V4BTX9_MICAE|nr:MULTISPECIES: hypothetical protein [Microcystis]NCQ98588.1 hypothetical protein [Microcystis aeruginosa L211-11]NCR30086.1 hypothetical protein [Microcystis aeruginosa L211-101]NCR75975.1 hypothetical protein [Microcystis aeruginosa K13-06]MCA2941374.1 hypothetical protein [Microcystis sp. M113S1]OPF17804.1 hypothetical protein B1L04_18095 [Microcystis aeruginosa KW]
MASIETVLRELSVAYGIYIVKNEIPKTEDPQKFIEICKKAIVKDDINESQYDSIKGLPSFTNARTQIINNGMKLAKIICSHDEFNKISAKPEIKWVGNSQKNELIDITVDNFEFSLKEKSNILNNMGLYQLINLLTDDTQKRGIHIFQTYAKDEYNQWFVFTWGKLLEYLDQHGDWHYVNEKKGARSQITKNNNDEIKFNYSDPVENKSATLPCNPQLTYDTYEKETTATIREKTLSKWISQELRNQDDYLQLKAKCSEQAGKSLVNYLKNHLSPNLSNLKKLLQILDRQYYYAKTNDSKQEIYKVPSEKEFNSIIKISKIDYEVPKSQLNIITTIENTETGDILQLRNELRYSHGQFNGIPEAKLYIHNSLNQESLSKIYKPIYPTR